MTRASYDSFTTALAESGLNLVGAVSADTAATLAVRPGADAALAAARSVLVCASGGRGHWESIPELARSGRFAIERHARGVLERSLPLLPSPSRLLDPAATHVFDLRRLAQAAGLGYFSPYLQMLIHPEFGPWVSLRGVVVTGLDAPARGPLEGFDPCTPCERPCLDACPSGAYRRGHAYDFRRCAEHRLQDIQPADHCADACHARRACVVGTEHAYGAREHEHRHRASLPDVAALYRARQGVRQAIDKR